MQKNEMDNVLVSREKWEALVNWVGTDFNKSIWAKEILAMPDFIESERDVEVVATVIAQVYPNPNSSGISSFELDIAKAEYRAVTDVLRYRKEGE